MDNLENMELLAGKAREAHLTRQMDLLPRHLTEKPIIVIDAGAVGGELVLKLAKMGFDDITVYDDDRVDIENLSCSIYPESAVGQLKVTALASLVRDFTGVEIRTHEERLEDHSDFQSLSGAVICAVDSMAARSLIWERIKYKVAVDLYIDPRMGAESAQIHALKPGRAGAAETYEATLYSDDNAVREPCTAKATMYCAGGLVSNIIAVVKAHLTGAPYPSFSALHFGAFDAYYCLPTS